MLRSKLFAAVSLPLVLLLSTGCESEPVTLEEQAEAAQEDLNEAREEAAETLEDAEEEAVETMAEARRDAKSEIADAKQEAEKMVNDAQQKLEEKLQQLGNTETLDKPETTQPQAEPGGAENDTDVEIEVQDVDSVDVEPQS